MESTTFYRSLFEGTIPQEPGLEINSNFWTPILQDELAKYEVLLTDLIQQQVKHLSKSMELEANLKRGQIPPVVQMKPRSFGQFSKFLSLEEISKFKDRSVEIAKKFENDMLNLLLEIRSRTDHNIKEKIDNSSILLKKSVTERLKQIGPPNLSESLQTSIKKDVQQWFSVSLPAVVKPIREKSEKKILDIRVQIETKESKLREAKDQQDTIMLDNTVLDDKEKITSIVKEVLQKEVNKKQGKLKKKSKNERLVKADDQKNNGRKRSQSHMNKKNTSPSHMQPLKKKTQQSAKKFYGNCFKCGEFGHRISECQSNTHKCFNCNGFGHITIDCFYDKKFFKSNKSTFNHLTQKQSNKKNEKESSFNFKKKMQISNSRVTGNPALKSRQNSCRN
jgi:hypothetical protein